MASNLTQNADEAEIARYEDLRSHANRLIWTIELQIRRLRAFPGELEAGSEFVLQCVSDAEFLVLSLDRLLSIARQVNNISRGNLDGSISNFEQALPTLHTARNIIAHLDEYLCGDGRDQSIRVGQLSTHVFDLNRMNFAGHEFDLEKALAVSQVLFECIRGNPPKSYRERVVDVQAEEAAQRSLAADGASRRG